MNLVFDKRFNKFVMCARACAPALSLTQISFTLCVRFLLQFHYASLSFKAKENNSNEKKNPNQTKPNKLYLEFVSFPNYYLKM